MAAQKRKKKKKLAEMFGHPLTKALNSLDSSRLTGRLSQNPKTGGFR